MSKTPLSTKPVDQQIEMSEYPDSEITPRVSTSSTHKSDTPKEYQDIGHPIDEEGEPLTWTFSRFLQEDRDSHPKPKDKHLALTWKNLTVTGVTGSTAFGQTCWSFLNPRAGSAPKAKVSHRVSNADLCLFVTELIIFNRSYSPTLMDSFCQEKWYVGSYSHVFYGCTFLTSIASCRWPSWIRMHNIPQIRCQQERYLCVC